MSAGVIDREAPSKCAAPPRLSAAALMTGGLGVGAATEADPDAAVAAELLQDGEVMLLLLRPSPLYIVLGSLGSLAFVAIVGLFLAYLASFAWIPWTDEFALGAGLLAALARIVWQALDWWNRIYILTDRRLIRRMGVLRVAVFEAPLSRIQHTSVFQRLRERLFGLGTLGFATAGSDVYEAFWAMIAKPFAVHRAVVEAMERYGRNRPR